MTARKDRQDDRDAPRAQGQPAPGGRAEGGIADIVADTTPPAPGDDGPLNRDRVRDDRREPRDESRLG